MSPLSERGVWIAAALAVACSAPPTTKSTAEAAPQRAACAPPVKAARWRHRVRSGRLVSQLGSPRHVVTDVVVGRGQTAVVRGKFAYGTLSKDLEGEAIELWGKQAPCRWRALGQAITNDDGRAELALRADAFDGPGPHELRAYALGDLTYAEAKVWVVAPERQAVLFDIDGTLTKDDGELLEELLGGEAELHPGADAVARRWANLGYLPVYITGRPYPLRASTFAWLIEHRFPRGPVLTVDSLGDALPGEAHVGAFKLATLQALTRAGLRFHRAYGNASTDVCAYARAGIAPERTFIVGAPRAGCDAAPPPRALASYVEHLSTIGDDQRVP
ncbi:MAG: hypothetical protein R3B48_12695 [Kofleriaceae bacterium]